MVKVKECCCGCSLRTGTLAIAWILLVHSCLLLLLNTFTFAKELRQVHNYHRHNIADRDAPSPFIFAYNVARLTVGIAISIIAIWALHKNRAKFLNGIFWYLCYYVITTIIGEIFLIIVPCWEQKLTETNQLVSSIIAEVNVEGRIFISFIYLFLIGIVSYFALVVKSCKDYALRIENQSSFEFSCPDPTYIEFRTS